MGTRRKGNMKAIRSLRPLAAAVTVFLLLATGPVGARWMIVGNDEKTAWDSEGRQLFFPDARKDSVCLIDTGKTLSLPGQPGAMRGSR